MSQAAGRYAPYSWQEQVRQALLKTDRAKVPERIKIANDAIDDRMDELALSSDGLEERIAIKLARSTLRALGKLSSILDEE